MRVSFATNGNVPFSHLCGGDTFYHNGNHFLVLRNWTENNCVDLTTGQPRFFSSVTVVQKTVGEYVVDFVK